MNDKFTKRLEEYLNSECVDYGLDYTWEWIDDCNYCEVTITKEYCDNVGIIHLKYDEKNDDLSIELSEDSYETTREFDCSVKYFWMLVAPPLFNN